LLDADEAPEGVLDVHHVVARLEVKAARGRGGFALEAGHGSRLAPAEDLGVAEDVQAERGHAPALQERALDERDSAPTGGILHPVDGWDDGAVLVVQLREASALQRGHDHAPALPAQLEGIIEERP